MFKVLSASAPQHSVLASSPNLMKINCYNVAKLNTLSSTIMICISLANSFGCYFLNDSCNDYLLPELLLLGVIGAGEEEDILFYYNFY